jgi:hypothetical protein
MSPVQNQQRPGALSYLGAGLGAAGALAGLATGGGASLGGMAAGALFPTIFDSNNSQPQSVLGGAGGNYVPTFQ